jgi:hypothetical protein
MKLGLIFLRLVDMLMRIVLVVEIPQTNLAEQQ